MNAKQHIVCWILIDPQTLEMVVRCDARADARDLAKGTDAIICKVVRSH